MYTNSDIIIIGISLFVIFALVLFFLKKFSKQQQYYKAIIDNSTNIVITTNEKELIEANKTFFTYFKQYTSLKEFSKNHECICEFFLEEEGYLAPSNGGISWIKYLVELGKIKHKVKMEIDGEVYYFLVSASKINKKNSIYAIIFSDITDQEITKHELLALSFRDEMTGIGNRKHYDATLLEQLGLAQRYVHPFSIMVLDIDYFKKVNDHHGHDTGDKVLKEYTKIIHEHLRRTDVFCRIGGEEFIIVLPHTTKDKAYLLAQKLRILVEEHKQIVPITMSFGLVQYVKGDDEESIFNRADTALYKAKDGGRNKAVIG